MLLLILIFTLGFSTGARAIPGSSLFCLEIPFNPPAYYQTVSKTCSPDKTVETHHVCSVNVKCGYVTQEMKSKAKKTTGKAFAELSLQERTLYLMNSDGFELFPSVLTCQAKPDSILCPAPNECASDLFYQVQITDFDLSKHDELNGKIRAGVNNLIEINRAAPSGKGN